MMQPVIAVDPNVSKLRRLATISGSMALRNVYTEAIAMSRLCTSWINVPASGNALCAYDTVNNRRTYTLRSQWGNIGNLVHELTHVAVNEAYGNDFINYANVRTANVPARTYGTGGGCTNEADRQMKLMNDVENVKINTKLMELIAWANASSIKDQQKNDIVSKLNYGRINPQVEFDTVINQILIWLTDWGYPVIGGSKKPVVNALYEEVEKVAMANWRNRHAGHGQ